MIQRKKEHYLEGITHITGTKPYSVHKTIFSSTNQQALYLHLHPEMELFYLESGSLDFFIEDTTYSMKAGDAIFIPPNLLHYANCTSTSDGVFRALVFSPDFVISPLEQDTFLKYIPSILFDNPAYALLIKSEETWQQNILTKLKKIFMVSKEEEDLYLMIHGMILIIWQYIYKHHISVLNHNMMEKGNKQLQITMHYIHEHYSEDISLPMLAEIAHMSSGHFCRSFKQLTTYTPFEYLKRYRILRSCSYLTDSNKKISEICLLCGFNSISYYNKEFLKIIKMTPSEYRKINKSHISH